MVSLISACEDRQARLPVESETEADSLYSRFVSGEISIHHFKFDPPLSREVATFLTTRALCENRLDLVQSVLSVLPVDSVVAIILSSLPDLNSPEQFSLFGLYLDALVFSDRLSELLLMPLAPLTCLLEMGMKSDRIQRQPEVHSRLADGLITRVQGDRRYLSSFAFISFSFLRVAQIKTIADLLSFDGHAGKVDLKLVRTVLDLISGLECELATLQNALSIAIPRTIAAQAELCGTSASSGVCKGSPTVFATHRPYVGCFPWAMSCRVEMI
jgi:hypothetical protein